jgi:MFS family permease
MGDGQRPQSGGPPSRDPLPDDGRRRVRRRAVAQVALGTAGTATTLKASVPLIFLGLALFTVGMWLPSLAVFVIGGIVTGAGAGLVFRGSLVAVAGTAPPESRAGALAGFFLGGYIGLSVPVIVLGVATEHLAARDVMLVFAVLAAAAIAAGVRAVLRHSNDRRS